MYLQCMWKPMVFAKSMQLVANKLILYLKIENYIELLQYFLFISFVFFNQYD